jgi:hypothetical protein
MPRMGYGSYSSLHDLMPALRRAFFAAMSGFGQRLRLQS